MDDREVNEAPKYITELDCDRLINSKLYDTRKKVRELSCNNFVHDEGCSIIFSILDLSQDID